MPELLFEIGTEELPSWYVGQAREAIGPLLAARLDAAGLEHGPLHAYATPRRVAVRVEAVADATERGAGGFGSTGVSR